MMQDHRALLSPLAYTPQTTRHKVRERRQRHHGTPVYRKPAGADGSYPPTAAYSDPTGHRFRRMSTGQMPGPDAAPGAAYRRLWPRSFSWHQRSARIRSAVRLATPAFGTTITTSINKTRLARYSGTRAAPQDQPDRSSITPRDVTWTR